MSYRGEDPALSQKLGIFSNAPQKKQSGKQYQTQNYQQAPQNVDNNHLHANQPPRHTTQSHIVGSNYNQSQPPQQFGNFSQGPRDNNQYQSGRQTGNNSSVNQNINNNSNQRYTQQYQGQQQQQQQQQSHIHQEKVKHSKNKQQQQHQHVEIVDHHSNINNEQQFSQLSKNSKKQQQQQQQNEFNNNNVINNDNYGDINSNIHNNNNDVYHDDHNINNYGDDNLQEKMGYSVKPKSKMYNFEQQGQLSSQPYNYQEVFSKNLDNTNHFKQHEFSNYEKSMREREKLQDEKIAVCQIF